MSLTESCVPAILAGKPVLIVNTGKIGNEQEVVKMLVDAGAGVSEQDQDGLTALMNAAEIGAGEIVAYLLNKG